MIATQPAATLSPTEPAGPLAEADWRPVLVLSDRCKGCGLCVAACPNQAIEFVPRADIPAIADSW